MTHLPTSPLPLCGSSSVGVHGVPVAASVEHADTSMAVVEVDVGEGGTTDADVVGVGMDVVVDAIEVLVVVVLGGWHWWSPPRITATLCPGTRRSYW